MKPSTNSIAFLGRAGLALFCASLSGLAGAAATTLADAPLYSNVIVPANVALALSVEWPTGDDDPYIGVAYDPAATYVGYWSSDWCYSYDTTVANGDGAAKGVFVPQVAASSHVCNSGSTNYWSGNFLNWALTQTIDPLRYALTGGYRSVDTSTNTVLQKAYSDGNVSNGGFPDKTLNAAATIKGATPFTSWTKLVISNRNLGRQFEFSSASPCGSKCGDSGGNTNSGLTLATYPGDAGAAAASSVTTIPLTCSSVTGSGSNKYCDTATYTMVTTVATSAVQTTTQYQQTCKTVGTKNSSGGISTCSVWNSPTVKTTSNVTVAYKLYGAVQVCVLGKDKGDSRCRGYPYSADGSTAPSVYKPTGLMQKYAAETPAGTDTIRYSAFGYLFDTSLTRDGGVMRARMKSVGPYMANPGQPVQPNSAANNPTTKTSAEWNTADGTFIANPDSNDASTYGPAGSNSGVINYLNQFGFSAGAYKSFDPVGEMYYAATRYYRGIGSVASYSNGLTTAMYDGFPVISFAANNDGTNSNAKDDPIAYTCSTNYIIGIGDIHTHADANLPGRTYSTSKEPAMPSEVSADASSTTGVNAVTAANWIATLENQISASGGGGSGGDYQLATGIGNAAIDSIGSPTGGWCCNSHSFLMAGLAYDLHTRDIRQDIVNKSSAITVSTFWLDVMENNDYHEKNQFWLTAKYGGFDTSQKDAAKNPLFSIIGRTPTLSASSDEYVRTKPLPTSWWNSGKLGQGSTKVDYVDSTGTLTANTIYAGNVDDHGNLMPDQYFQASNPSKMISGLNAAFLKIVANAPAGTSSALGLGSSSVATAGNINYVSQYANDWSGSVSAQSLVVKVTGSVLSTDTGNTKGIWDAGTWLPPNSGAGVLTYDTRVIATSSGFGAGKGVPFRFGNLSTGQKAQLVSPTWTSATQTQVLNYVRGDRSNEGSTASSSFRLRNTSVLGDITNSQPVVYGSPSLPYADTPLNPGYSAFKTAKSSRGPVLYVGANDGMLHAFDATASCTTSSGITTCSAGATGGKELFAYVPSALLTTNVDSSGNPVGLGSLTANPLNHHFMVDAVPVVRDVDFARANLATTDPTWATAPSDWRTIVIAGLGKGGGTGSSATTCANGRTSCVGGGYVALDVTDPSTITNEATLASKVLWETDPSKLVHMGYSYGLPHIIKTKKYGWTVVLTSGYGNDDGGGYIYLINPKDGSLYEIISANVGAPSTTNPAGLAHLVASVPSGPDFTADALYAGDLLGNVWRVDLTQSTYKAEQFATLVDPLTSKPQPVTTYPVTAIDPTSQKRYVFVGTGQLLSDADLVNTQTQTFYAFIDGTNAAIDKTSTFPIKRTDLIADDPATGVTATALVGKRGFYMDLAPAATSGTGTQASAERINVQMVANSGVVLFAANLYGQNICNKGSSRVFSLNFDSGLDTDSSGNVVIGKTLLQSADTPSVRVSSLQYLNGVVTNLTLVNGPGSGSSTSSSMLTAMWGLDTTSGGTGKSASSEADGNILFRGKSGLTRINWREVPDSQ
ncbi:MAG: hypothetical protein JSS59_10790 [Proteobacteria bacterium]|uniref:pilus assembly protein n=1 Tax=Rudaea sp. TaxID=2136325 RepID=UPI003783C2DF|nr:hypothetical protein [Pseudomonadota bacterium]